MKSVERERSSRRSRTQPKSGNLFGWTVFILLLCGFAVTCWIGTFYVFSRPEKPFNYQILTKLNKLELPKRFELTGAPIGEFLSAEKLLGKYGAMTTGQLNEESNGLLRSYLRNYDHMVGKVPYATGKFTILGSYPLSDSKFFTSGVVVVAQSVDAPTAYIEHIFPASADKLSAIQRTLMTGLGIELRRSYDLSAVINVESLGKGRLLFTCMPLLYGPYGTTQSGSGFQLDPPKVLNPRAGLPLVTQNQLRDAEQRYAQYRKATGGSEIAVVDTMKKSAPNLVSSEPIADVSPTSIPTPALPASTASPVVAKAIPVPNTTLTTVVAKASPPATLTPTPTAATAVGAPAIVPTQPLQPFLTASPTPATSGRVGVWQTYRPGKMPRGKLLDVDQTADLANKGIGNDTIYLRGDFTVTVARDNRAILRPRQSLANRVFNHGKARIIAEFPRGTTIPRAGENFQRSTDRPFAITDVRRGVDGQVNIYVREVTTEQ